MEGSGAPIIEVSNLVAAASFYAALTQPLGISYLTASPARLHFGFVRELATHFVFILQQSAIFPPRASRITLLAQSPAAVESFYQRSLAANQAQRDHSLRKRNEDTIARTRDLDGNMLEAIYASRPGRPIETASTPKEAKRVLDWQEEVARSVEPADLVPKSLDTASEISQHSSSERYYTTSSRPADSTPPITGFAAEPRRLVRKEIITTERVRRSDERSLGNGNGDGGITTGFSGLKLAGMLLGAAAGAAVAYALVSADSPPPRAAPPPRRASYGDRHGYSVVERMPARSYGREAELPPYVALHAISAPPPPPVSMGSMTKKRGGSVSRRPKHVYRERSRSDVGSRYQQPLALLPQRPRSPEMMGVGRRTSRRRAEKMYASDWYETEPESYVSGRSHRSERTIRQPSPPQQQPPNVVQYVTTTKTMTTKGPSSSRKGSGGGSRRIVVPVDDRERRSVVSARAVPLPPSVVGSSVLGGRGYASSVAPSDSVSSVGSKRERERLRERMRERW